VDRQTRVAYLMDHYRSPRHRGALDPADVVMPGGNPGCGDVVTLYVRADGEQINEVSFEGEGCTISQAAASILAQRINRQRPEFGAVQDLSYESMIELLGRDIVGSRPRCATLALGTLKAAVRRLEMDRRLRAAGRSDEEIAALRDALHRQAAGTGLVFGDAAKQVAAGPRPHPPAL
jgi:nitrogen fixation protein NifU and related proteins